MKKLFVISLLLLATSIFSIDRENMSARDFYLAGKEAFDNFDYYTAYEYYNNAAVSNPRYFQPLEGLSLVLFTMGEYSQALDYVDKALSFNKNSVKLLNLKGRILIGLAKFTEAREIFNSILKNEPYNIEASLGLADLNVVYGSYDLALKSYQNILTLAPNDKRTLLSLIFILENINKSKNSTKYVEQVLFLYPNDINVRLIAATHYKNLKKNDEAILNARLAIDMKKDYLDAALLISKIYFEQTEYQKIIDIMSPLLSYKNDKYIVHYYLGLANAKLELFDTAVKHFQSALKYRQGDEISRIALENIIEENGLQQENLINILSKYHYKKGDEFFKRNIPYRAYQEFRRGLSLNILSREGREGVGEYYKIKKYFSKYAEVLDYLNTNFPNDHQITDNIETLQFKLEDSVSNLWGVDQFEIIRDTTDISIFVKKVSDNVFHYGLDNHFYKYFKQYIIAHEQFNLSYEDGVINSYSEAFKQAKINGSNYFIIFSLDENSRTITVKTDIYWTATGILLDSFTISRTGNNMILNSCDYITNYLLNAQPKLGRIVQINFDDAIINLGNIDGIKVGDKFNIVKKGYIYDDKKGFNKVYNDKYILGTFTVTKCDDLISEGNFEKRYYYNLINEDDKVIIQTEVPKKIENNQVGRELYREILKLG